MNHRLQPVAPLGALILLFLAVALATPDSAFADSASTETSEAIPYDRDFDPDDPLPLAQATPDERIAERNAADSGKAVPAERAPDERRWPDACDGPCEDED